MKKIVFFLFATMLVASVKAQVYVGGTVGLWHNDDLDATFFKLEPEVGYNLSEKWAVGGVLAFAHGKADEGKYNAFALAPYARYSYYENKVVRLFVDGGFGFSTQNIVNVDVSTIYKGYFADASRMFMIGEVSPDMQRDWYRSPKNAVT